MKKQEIINACIDMAYKTSKAEIRRLIIEATGNKYMQTKDSVAMWKAVYENLQNAEAGEGGETALFMGSNIEFYRK